VADHARYLEEIRAKVAEHGHAVQQVAAAEGEASWSYTIGLHAAGLPELIIVGGLGLAGQGSVLNRLAERLREGETLPVGERDPSVLEGVDVTYLEVADTTTEDFAVALRLQSDFRALQVVWPDLENRFPWEPGYAFPPDEQRLLGAVD
jgi:Domain of unknown function (DUF4262)